MAQLTLPNGKLICGKPLSDRVLASESVAEEALKELTKKVKFTEMAKFVVDCLLVDRQCNPVV